MLYKGLFFIFLAVNIFGDSLDELLIQLEKNSSLIQAQKSIVSAKQKDISIQTNYKNPKLSFGVNDIMLSKDKYNKFDLEPMQTQYIAISQEIEDGDKIDSKKSIALYALQKENFVLEDLYYDLLKQLRQINIQIIKSKEILSLLDKKILNLNTLKKYFINTTSSMTNISLLSKADEKIYKAKEQKYNLLTKIDNLQNRFSYILGEQYNIFNDDLNNLNDQEEFELTPKYKAYEMDKNIAKEQVTYAKLEESPNFTFNFSYNRRESFDNYVNVGIAIPLPIYGTEEEKVIKTNELFRKSTFAEDDFLRKVKMKYENYKSKTLFLKNSLNDITLVIESLDSELSYSNNNFNDVSNTPQIIENRNKKIDFEIRKVQLLEQIDLSRLEIDYITRKSKL
ncbi:TolC family protein [Sulfurimonas sp.]|uniref:TolC family protein n=1 Tax=Sulfurimonas sp. TaxID=2022749 RepID=UPI0035693BA0